MAAIGAKQQQGQAYAGEALWGGAKLFTDDAQAGQNGAILFADKGAMTFSSLMANNVKMSNEAGMDASANFEGAIPTVSLTFNGKKYSESDFTPANKEPKGKVINAEDFRILPFRKKGHVTMSFNYGSSHRVPEWASSKHQGHVNYAIVGLKGAGSCGQGKVLYGGAKAFAV